MSPQSFELTTRMNGVQRSRGHSATARAAYRAMQLEQRQARSQEPDQQQRTQDQGQTRSRARGGPEFSP